MRLTNYNYFNIRMKEAREHLGTQKKKVVQQANKLNLKPYQASVDGISYHKKVCTRAAKGTATETDETNLARNQRQKSVEDKSNGDGFTFDDLLQ